MYMNLKLWMRFRQRITVGYLFSYLESTLYYHRLSAKASQSDYKMISCSFCLSYGNIRANFHDEYIWWKILPVHFYNRKTVPGQVEPKYSEGLLFIKTIRPSSKIHKKTIKNNYVTSYKLYFRKKQKKSYCNKTIRTWNILISIPVY